MKKDNNEGFIIKSFKEQQIILKDERHININEKTSEAVSKIMNWIFIALLFITGVVMKNYTCLFMVSIIIIAKTILTIGYSYYYSHKI
ncbi:MAG: hypothetical protein RR128_00730 [Clostridium sp.]